jgi:L-glyceraldehyde 3-phosphate reductase
VGASKPEQLSDSMRCLDNVTFGAEELKEIDDILQKMEAT